VKWIQTSALLRERHGRRRRCSSSLRAFTTEIDWLDILSCTSVRRSGSDPLVITIVGRARSSVSQGDRAFDDPTAHSGNTADAFHVVCPSLPGFGLLLEAYTTGWGVGSHSRQAGRWLMDRLEYSRYFAQGGDWGSASPPLSGAQDTDIRPFTHARDVGGGPTSPKTADAGEARALKGIEPLRLMGLRLFSSQCIDTPQTLAMVDGFADGQARVDPGKSFLAWTDCGLHPENILGRDELLDNVMLYW